MSVYLDHQPPALRIKLDRCWTCGRWYGVEPHANPAEKCPACAAARIEALFEQVGMLERSNQAYRAAATRRRKQSHE